MYITVETKDGNRELLKIPDGNRASLTQILKEHGYPVSCICNRMGICTSCHVRVLAAIEKIPKPGEAELARLESLPDRRTDSRLACQIVPDQRMNGIIIRLVR